MGLTFAPATRRIAFAAAMLGAWPLQAQQAATPAAPQPAAASPFRLERFAEDWSVMADPSARTKPWHAVKWIELGQARLTIGGDLRLRAEHVDAPMFGATGSAADSYLMRRAMVHADLRLGPSVRLFGQVSHHAAWGRKMPFPLDRNGLEAQQAFVEIGDSWTGGSLGARIGRQEMIFSPRFLHPREATNIRSAFDGVRAWTTHGPWRADGFVTRPVQNRPGAFDDRGNPAERFDGVRLTRTLGSAAAWRITGSWYRHRRDALRLNAVSGPDDRRSWGVRIAGKEGAFDIDAEHYRQTGRFAGRAIAAFGGAGEAGYLAGGRLRVRPGLRWLYGSGDGDPGDGTAGTFAGPFPRPPCCIDALWLAPSNAAVLTPFVQFSPHRDLAIEAKADVVRRLRRTDAVYAFPQVAYPGSAGLPGDDLGYSAGLSLTWTPSPEVSVLVQHIEQQPAGALASAGARQSSYSAASVGFRF